MDHSRLPPEVQELARRLGAEEGSSGSIVRFSQRGRMRQDGAPRWMGYRAKQAIRVSACRFDWRAHTGPAGLATVRDALTDRGGRLVVRALGIVPIACSRDIQELIRGELMRYLAEIAWAPDAILHNRHLQWRAEKPGTLEVSAAAGNVHAVVVLQLDGEGRISNAYAPDRPRALGRRFIPTPWTRRLFDYRLHDGRWLPFGAEVGWEIGGEDVICWDARIERWRLE